MAAGDGLISMAPTSIAYSGTSASINADGGVDFSAVTSLSLNGVFTGDYDNYRIVMSYAANFEDAYFYVRLRASGTDASGTDYTVQRLNASGSSLVAIERNLSQTAFYFGRMATTANGGGEAHLYGPALAQPTAFRSVTVSGVSGAYLTDSACTHSLSTSYDGVTFNADNAARNLTGTVHVFGYEE